MTKKQNIPKLLILCTVSTGLDSVLEVCKRGYPIEAIVGLNPKAADPVKISGYIDIKKFATENKIKYRYVDTYNLSTARDVSIFSELYFELIWVAGWQRLIPEWLINQSKLGALGGHGSPDGISGGRGRSPQNWALILGAKRFDYSIFKISPGIDDGPVIGEKSFFYNELDDIQTSYYKASLCAADIICEILNNIDCLSNEKIQNQNPYYYPQRIPSDGFIDWNLEGSEISRHCRALTKPYPGIRTTTANKNEEIIIWNMQIFDDFIEKDTGLISHCFLTGDFLVSCADGRMLVREWESKSKNWIPQNGEFFKSLAFSSQINEITKRHMTKHPENKIAKRITLRSQRD